MTSRMLAVAALLLWAGFTPRIAVAGIITAASLPPDGSTLTVGDPLTITLSVDPSQIDPSPATVTEAVYAVFQLSIGFDTDNIFGIAAAPVLTAGTFLVTNPDAALNQLITVTETIDPSTMVIPAFEITLYYTATAGSPDPVTFSAVVATSYRSSEGVIQGSQRDDITYDSQQNLTYAVVANAVPEPASLAVWSLVAGIFGVVGLRKRLRRSAAA